jgi:hypothetical protein
MPRVRRTHKKAAAPRKQAPGGGGASAWCSREGVGRTAVGQPQVTAVTGSAQEQQQLTVATPFVGSSPRRLTASATSIHSLRPRPTPRASNSAPSASTSSHSYCATARVGGSRGAGRAAAGRGLPDPLLPLQWLKPQADCPVHAASPHLAHLLPQARRSQDQWAPQPACVDGVCGGLVTRERRACGTALDALSGPAGSVRAAAPTQPVHCTHPYSVATPLALATSTADCGARTGKGVSSAARWRRWGGRRRSQD